MFTFLIDVFSIHIKIDNEERGAEWIDRYTYMYINEAISCTYYEKCHVEMNVNFLFHSIYIFIIIIS